MYRLYKLERWLYLHKVPYIPMLIKIVIRIFFSAVIPYQADIGNNTLFGYQGLGVVIHKQCKIGENCIICQNVTLAGTKGKDGVPTLGDHVYVGAGAIVIGDIVVGNNVRIGANAVVISDLPDDCTAVGIPARIKKR